MGTSLTGLTPATTYDALIKVGDNGPLTGSLKTISDGLGNDSALALSTGSATITGSLTTTAKTLAERVQVGTAATLNDPTGVGNTLQFANYSPTVFVTGSADSYIYKNSSAFSGLSAQSLIFQTRSDVTGGGFAFVAGGTPAPIVTMTGSGNVGIGTSTPASKFHIAGADAWMTLQRTSGTTNILDFTDSASVRLGYVGFISSNLTLNAKAGSDIIFAPNNDERGRFTSNGLTFNGDTAAANALDDYEEGTWTPTFAGSTTNPTITYAVQSGFYTKIGRQVTITLEIGTTANSGGVGSVQVSGLPFTVGSRVYNCVATYNINNSATNPMSIFAEVIAGGTKVNFLATGDDTTWISVNWTDATNSTIYINGSFTYFV